jgi:membrane protease YdiL (CAAX protease family)
MRGILRGKSPGVQLIIVIGIALFNLFFFGLIGTLILSKITGISLAVLSDPLQWDYNNQGIITYIRGMQIVQFIVLFLIPSLLCSYLFSLSSRTYLGLRKPSMGIYFLIGILVMVISFPLVQWLGELNQSVRFPTGIEGWLKAREKEAEKAIHALLSRQTIKELLLNILLIAGLAAVGEELLFRGILQRLFIRIFKSPWVGIIVAAFIFSAIHMQFYGFVPRFILGVLLGALYWYSGSLWVSILAHFIYDAVLIVVAYFHPEMLVDESTVKLSGIALWGTISLATTCLLVFWMVRNSRTSFRQVFASDMEKVKDHPF